MSFSGVLSGDEGVLTSTALRDACSVPTVPAFGTFRTRIRLVGVSLQGLTGDLVIDLEGVFEAHVAELDRTRSHGTITESLAP